MEAQTRAASQSGQNSSGGGDSASSRATDKLWQSSRAVWALRGCSNFDVKSAAELQSVMQETIKATDAVLQMLRSMSGFDVRNFHSVGSQIDGMAVADHLDLTCSAVMIWLKSGLASAQAGVREKAEERLRPLETALLMGASKFRNLSRTRAFISSIAARDVSCQTINSDFNIWSGEVRDWCYSFSYTSPPASFDGSPLPPAPKFPGVASMASPNGSFAQNALAKAAEHDASQNKRMGTGQTGRSAKRNRSETGYCYKFNRGEPCKYNPCKYRHEIRPSRGGGGDAGNGNGGGGGSGGAGGQGSAGAASGSGRRGNSSAMVVRQSDP